MHFNSCRNSAERKSRIQTLLSLKSPQIESEKRVIMKKRISRQKRESKELSMDESKSENEKITLSKMIMNRLSHV
jgi:hypothetical protein